MARATSLLALSPRPPALSLLFPSAPRAASPWVARAEAASSSSAPATTTKQQQQPSQQQPRRPKSRNSNGNGRASPPPSASPPSPLPETAREQQLWDRQAALAEREQRRWDQERAAWRAREAALLHELAETRKALVALALATAGRGGGGALSSSSSSAAPAAAPAPASSDNNAPAWAQLFEQTAAPPSPSAAGEPSVSSRPPPDAGAEDDEEARVASSVAAAMGAAMAAVQQMDVLSADTDAFLAAALAGNNKSSSQSSSSTSTAPAAPATPATTSAPPPPPPAVETPRGDPQGPPPVLSAGDDDIYWMDRLHTSLTSRGYYAPDEEIEAWVFGPGTTTALLTFQACSSLPETGCADDATWRALLGDEEVDRRQRDGGGGARAAGVAAPAPAVAAAPAPVVAPAAPSSPSSPPTTTTKQRPWPVLAEMDGGRAVHRLQVALTSAGFHCGEDEMQWWQFGATTLESLRTFQACGGLPETGVTCARTWAALLGEEARPEDLEAPVEAKEGGTFEEDLTVAAGQGRVWLLGEQRWSKEISRAPPSSEDGGAP